VRIAVDACDGPRLARISTPASAGDQATHATGYLELNSAETVPVDAVTRSAGWQHIPSARAFYARFERLGYTVGPAFQWLAEGRVSGNEAVWRLERPVLDPRDAELLIHPGLIDSCFQVLGTISQNPSSEAARQIQIPFAVDRVVLHRAPRPDEALFCYGRLAAGADPAANLRGDLTLLNELGEPLLTIERVSLRSIAESALRSLVQLEPQPSASPEREAAHSYVPVWCESPPTARGLPSGTWLVVADDDPLSRELRTQLVAAGCSVVWLHNERLAALELAAADTARSIFDTAELARLRSGVRGVVQLCGVIEPVQEVVARQVDGGCGRSIRLLGLLERERISVEQIWFVTRGAQCVAGSVTPGGWLDAAQWGFARTLRIERPDLQVRLCDLDASSTDSSAAAQLIGELAGMAEEEIAIRRGSRYALRLTPVESSSDKLIIQESSAYLISGGFGALGMQTAEWLVEHGARRIALLGRHPADEALRSRIEALNARGASILCLQTDITERAQVANAVSEVHAKLGQIRGVFHAAGTTDDAVSSQQTRAQLQRVLEPKLIGALNLLSATEADLPEFFVGYSSVVALLGGPGQSNYAAANAALDALLMERRALGAQTCTIDWGPWRGAGMAGRVSAATRKAWREAGLALLEPEAAFEQLSGFLASDSAQRLTLAGDLRKLQPRLFAPVAGAAAESAGLRVVRELGIIELVRGCSQSEAERRLTERLRQLVAQMLRLDPSEVDADVGFAHLGFDSLMAVEVKALIETELHTKIPVTSLFDYPTAASLSAHIVSEWLPADWSTAEVPQCSQSIFEHIDALTEEEAEVELAQLLKNSA
ncbi:MAG TPA: SDR family NAD(P)-dependent oxidoreductase, partial [Polyangiaceae bacterium]